jgi:hypothetical protein
VLLDNLKYDRTENSLASFVLASSFSAFFQASSFFVSFEHYCCHLDLATVVDFDFAVEVQQNAAAEKLRKYYSEFYD